jgi:hypothetical protein
MLFLTLIDFDLGSDWTAWTQNLVSESFRIRIRCSADGYPLVCLVAYHFTPHVCIFRSYTHGWLGGLLLFFKRSRVFFLCGFWVSMGWMVWILREEVNRKDGGDWKGRMERIGKGGGNGLV